MEKSLTGYYGNLTPEQTKVYNEFVNATKKLAQETWKYDISRFDEYDILRFLRARKFDLPKCIEMFTKFIKWRIEFRTDDVLVFL